MAESTSLALSNPSTITDLPDRWRVARIEDVCQKVTSGGTPSRSNPAFYRNGTIDWYKTGELKDGWLEGSEEKITSEAVASSSAKVFPINTVLLALYGDGKTITSLGMLRRPGATNQACCAMIADPAICDHRFLFYSLKLHREDLIFIASGGAQRNLSGKLMRDFGIRLPPLPEQRAIAGVLGALDDKIEVNRKTARVLEGIARAVFTSWFVDFDPVRRRAASLPGSAAPLPADLAALFPTRLVDSPIGEVPEGWRVAELSEIVEVIDCLHTKKPERTDAGRLLLQLANIRDAGLLDPSDQYLISEDDYARWSAKFETRAGDCVITNVGRVGAVAQIPDGVKAALGRNMTGLRPRSNFPYPTFLIHALLSESMRGEIVLKTDSGTILDALNVRSIGKLRVVAPPVALLKHFEMRFRSLRERVEHTIRQSAPLAALRDVLLPKLISGELRIGDAERIVGTAV